jgi:hypothetical protein
MRVPMLIVLLILLSNVFPLWQAWRANRNHSLSHAIGWTVIAWIGWCLVVLSFDLREPLLAGRLSYLALCLTGCAGMAVLGARRPGVTAWNLVVLGLLAVNVLPLMESLLKGGTLNLDGYRAVCVAATIAVGILNYLPTRLAPAAVVLFIAVGGTLWTLLSTALAIPKVVQSLLIAPFFVGFVPWIAYVCIQNRPTPSSEFDRLWLDFRDRYGFLWSARLRGQFNNSASNAGWPVVLRWQGLRLQPGTALPVEEAQNEMVTTLQALMKRFGPKT